MPHASHRSIRSSALSAPVRTIAFLFIAGALLASCQTAPSTRGARLVLQEESRGTLAIFRQEDPTMRENFFDKAHAWAVFPTVGKGAVGIGGAYGRGVVYERRDGTPEVIGYCDLSQGTVGFQLGGQAYREIIFFEYEEALRHFKSGNFAFAAQASAVAIEAGASADAKYDRGVAVFTMPKGGLMFEASIGGQKFSYEPAD